MFPPFDEERAKEICYKMILELSTKKSLNGHDEFKNFCGMFGVLVCKDKNQNEVVLKAFSGSCCGKWNIKDFAPPLFDEEKYNEVISINDKEIHELSLAPKNETVKAAQERKKKRLFLCNETLSKIYALYNFTCADGIVRNFSFLCDTSLPPTGTGDCAEPKLLSYAFSLKLKPFSMAQFFYDSNFENLNDAPCNDTLNISNKVNHLKSKQFYPPCDQKCGLILPIILGLKIIYRDNDIIVVNKPSGLLSVPGRGEHKQDCVVRRVQNLFPNCIQQPAVHRLDMDTSGLMVLAFNEKSQRALSMQFADGIVEKKYIAVLDGIPKNKTLNITKATKSGRIELKFRVDIENRPHQIYDEVYGKNGITLWERLRIWKMNGKNVTSVLFIPQTGRTHQLRLAASNERGLNAPIVGDNLYGTQKNGERLMLHASYLKFTHPTKCTTMEFSSAPDFKY